MTGKGTGTISAGGFTITYARGPVARQAQLGLFEGDPIEHRFYNPSWRKTRRPVPLPALLEKARAIDPAECRRLTFRDAPLAHPDFAALVKECRALGLSGLEVETDGVPLASAGAVEALAEQGFETVFVFAAGLRRPVHDAVMRDDAFAEAFEGLRLAAASTLRVYVVAPLLKWTEKDLVPFAEYLALMERPPAGLFLYPPEPRNVPAQAHALLLSQGEQARVAAQVFSTCQRHRLEYGFFRDLAPLPCAAGGALDRFGTVFFNRLSVLKHKAEHEERHVRVEACATCSLQQSCPGVDAAYLSAFGDRELKPVPLEVSMDWKLKPIHSLDRRGLKSVSAFENDTESNGRSLLRINGHCNMSCSFCFIDRTVSDLDTGELLRAIDALAARHLDHLVLSGGEPTIHPDLPALIRHASRLGFRTVEIQTNGVKLASPEYAKELADSGLTKITVSLHSADPEHSDKITRLPKAFDKTVRAIHNARALGLETQVAHVISKSNYRELPDTVRFLREEFPPGGGSLSICFGIAQPISDLVYTWVMPTFDEVKPYMRRALDYCLEHGVGFGGMIGQGGYPPCMLDGDLRYYEMNLVNIYKSGGSGDFHKPERCRECSFDRFCPGVRRYYVDTYGDGEIRPFRADVDALVRRAAPEGP